MADKQSPDSQQGLLVRSDRNRREALSIEHSSKSVGRQPD